MSRGLVDKFLRLCESRGFVIESRVDGPHGTSYAYNYGPLGTELRRNLRNAWWHDVVSTKGYVHGIETDFSFLQEKLSLNNKDASPRKTKENRNNEKLIDAPESSDKNVWQSSIQLVTSVPGLKLPFGIARNKTCVRSSENNKYLLRSCKGEVMSLQFFCAENRTNDWTNFWRRQRLVWWRKFANTPSNYTIQESQSDIKPGVNSYTLLEYGFTWGKEILDTVTVWSALCKDIADNELSGLPFNKHSLPHVLEVNTDLDKGFLAILMDAFLEVERADSSGNVAVRTVLHLHPHLAPIKVAVVPQEPLQSELCEVAQQLSSELREAGINTQFSRDGSSPDECHVYSDEIGTPYCVTILDTTLSNGVVTFRSRNTTLQEFLHISEILSTVKRHLGM